MDQPYSVLTQISTLLSRVTEYLELLYDILQTFGVEIDRLGL